MGPDLSTNALAKDAKVWLYMQLGANFLQSTGGGRTLEH